MNHKEGRCPACFEPAAGSPCPHCGWRPENAAEPPMLPAGTLLNDQYLIGRPLGHGGFGITYLAWDRNLKLKLAIKEYLPGDLATRGPDGATLVSYSGAKGEWFHYGLDRFLEEAQILARFQQHPGIVSVLNFFRAHNTGYMVMEYVDGITLKEYLQRQGERIPFDEALRILTPVMDALRAVHKDNLLHRDIAPDNIYITQGGQIKLLDFGAARFATEEHSRSLSVILKPGYAPYEQYSKKGKQGPWTDVYALAATLYRCIVGEPPPESLDRVDEDELQTPAQRGLALPPAAEQALLAALAVRARERTQDIQTLQQGLKESAAGPIGQTGSTGGANEQPPQDDGRGQARPRSAKATPLQGQTRAKPEVLHAAGGGLGKGLAVLALLGAASVGGWFGYDQWQQRQTAARAAVEPAANRTTEARTEQPINPARLPFEPEMADIPAGSFRMGDLQGGGNSDEKPVHTVNLEAFRMGKHEVTVGQFRAFVEDSDYRTEAERDVDFEGCYTYESGSWEAREGRSWRNPGLEQDDGHPAVCVSWNDARAYAEWLSKKTDKAYRLPSEAEWEYAARAGTGTKYWWGNQDPVCTPGARNGAKFDDNAQCDQTGTEAVGTYQENDNGLYDVHGNVWEWTEDCRNNSYEDAPTNGSAWRHGNCISRVLRGGSWNNLPGNLRAATRGNSTATGRGTNVGFRLAQDL